MTSRTPIRLTPHRGPLATPSTSPESSPTTSTPPTDISYCSTDPSLDIAILQLRISALDTPTLHRRGHEAAQKGLFGRDTQLRLASEGLTNACHAIAGTVTICLLIWGLLEWVFNDLLAFALGC